jgi:anthranilate phosphoribosyltransferase
MARACLHEMMQSLFAWNDAERWNDGKRIIPWLSMSFLQLMAVTMMVRGLLQARRQTHVKSVFNLLKPLRVFDP